MLVLLGFVSNCQQIYISRKYTYFDMPRLCARYMFSIDYINYIGNSTKDRSSNSQVNGRQIYQMVWPKGSVSGWWYETDQSAVSQWDTDNQVKECLCSKGSLNACDVDGLAVKTQAPFLLYIIGFCFYYRCWHLWQWLYGDRKIGSEL